MNLYDICSERAKRGAQAVPCPLLNREELDTFILTMLRDELFAPTRLPPLLEELAASAITQTEDGRRKAKRLRGEVATLDTELARFYQAIAEDTVAGVHEQNRGGPESGDPVVHLHAARPGD